MKLNDLLNHVSGLDVRSWFNDSTDATYISAADCPTKESALAAYADLVGEPWGADYLDEVVEKILPCCDHDIEDCEPHATTRICTKAIKRKVWAFEP